MFPVPSNTFNYLTKINNRSDVVYCTFTIRFTVCVSVVTESVNTIIVRFGRDGD